MLISKGARLVATGSLVFWAGRHIGTDRSRVFDDRIDSSWALAIQAKGSTSGEDAAHWAAHPDWKAEQERRIRLDMANKDLHSVGGIGLDSLHVSNAGSVLVRGRDGMLMRGTTETGFQAVPCEADAVLSEMARFEGAIYPSSYANPRGVLMSDGTSVRRIYGGRQPEPDDVHAVDAGEDASSAIGSRVIAQFDETSWERVPMPT